MKYRTGALNLDDEAEGQVGILGASPESSGRKSQEYGRCAANVTGKKATHWPESATGLMEEIFSRGNMIAAYSRVVKIVRFPQTEIVFRETRGPS